MSSPLRTVQPPGWAPPRGYANGVAGRGEVLFVGGQIGWDADGAFPAGGFVPQFAQALRNVLAVVRAAGGEATHVARMTVFVTDLAAYRASLRALGVAWREVMGGHYPAMSLVGVSGLVEPAAMVEIEATAVLPHAPGDPAP